MNTRLIRRTMAGLAAGAIMAVGGGAAAEAALLPGPFLPGPTPPGIDERCKVPPLLFQVAAVVDPDSLEGCNFFEDPNFFDDRKAAGLYNDNGAFTQIFG